MPASAPSAESTPAPAAVEELALPYCADPASIRHYSGFALLYSEEHEQPYWVVYLLTDDEVQGTYGRTDNFRADPHVATGSASLEDYRDSASIADTWRWLPT